MVAGVKVTLINSNGSINHVTNGCVISVNMFTPKRQPCLHRSWNMATAKCCLCLRNNKETWLLCRSVMFTAWGLTKAACRMIKMFTERGLIFFTRGEGMYTGRSLICLLKRGDLLLLQKHGGCFHHGWNEWLQVTL